MLVELKTHHREIARLVFEGHKAEAIATRMNLVVGTVRGILSDHLFKAYVARLNDKADEGVIDVRKKLAEMNEDAIDTIAAMIRPGGKVPAAVSLKAAESVLDRNGYKAPDRVEHVHGHFTADDIAELKARGKAAIQARQGTTINLDTTIDIPKEDVTMVDSTPGASTILNGIPYIIDVTSETL